MNKLDLIRCLVSKHKLNQRVIANYIDVHEDTFRGKLNRNNEKMFFSLEEISGVLGYLEELRENIDLILNYKNPLAIEELQSAVNQ